MKAALTGPRPRAHPHVSPGWLTLAAALSITTWFVVERVIQSPIHPHYAEMLTAARAMQAASRVLVAEKAARGIMPMPDIDPNRTGMIGAEFTPITSTLGDLVSKRTTTNPDFAAALARLLASLDLPRGAPVVIVVSGSFPAANVAAIAAVEALGLKPIIIASLSASMWGANDPQFNWLDMAAVLRSRGVIRAGVTAAVLGGSVEPDGVTALRASATRNGVPLVEERPFAALIENLLGRIKVALGEGLAPGAVINVGGAQIGLGSCREAYEIAPGVLRRPIPCAAPGLAVRLLEQGLPMLQVLNMKRLAVEMGLPIDPVPLPSPGHNRAIYGSGRSNPG